MFPSLTLLHYFFISFFFFPKNCVIQEVPVEITGFLKEARNGLQKGSLANMIASSWVYKSSYNIQNPPPSSPCLHHSPSSFFLTIQKTEE